MRVTATFATLALALCFIVPLPVRGVQSSGGPASTTSWNPGAITAWDYVGSIGQASGVYLGSYGGSHWVITAAHVGSGSFNLGGYSYSAVGGSLVTFNPTDGGTYQPDLAMFRIDAGAQESQSYLDSLGGLAFETSALAAGTDVRLIGHGDNDSSATIKSWGDNVIAGKVSFTIGEDGHYGGVGYYTLDANGVAAVVGDSGGGMFYLLDDELWVLGGIMVAVGDLDEEGHGTVIIGLSTYADQILAAIPEPASLAAISALLVLGSAVVGRCRKHA